VRRRIRREEEVVGGVISFKISNIIRHHEAPTLLSTTLTYRVGG